MIIRIQKNEDGTRTYMGQAVVDGKSRQPFKENVQPGEGKKAIAELVAELEAPGPVPGPS